MSGPEPPEDPAPTASLPVPAPVPGDPGGTTETFTETRQDFVRHSAVMSVGTGLSRLTGFLRLFAMAYRHLVVDLHERLVARGWRDVRPHYGYVLLACRDQPTTSGGLAALLGVSKQAARERFGEPAHR